MKKTVSIAIFLTFVLLSCSQGQNSSSKEYEIQQLLSEVALKDRDIEQLSQNLSAQNDKYQELMTKYSELETRLQNEIGKSASLTANTSLLDLTGLYKITTDTEGRIPSGIRILTLGEGYWIESIELVDDPTGYSAKIAGAHIYVSPKQNNRYEFIWYDLNHLFHQKGYGVIAFDIAASSLGLHGIAYFDGDRDGEIEIEYVKVSNDPYEKLDPEN